MLLLHFFLFYARFLDFTGVVWQYEPKEFVFQNEVRGVKVYNPDFFLPETDGWVEVKGWLDSKSKSKLKKFKKYYPEEFNKLKMVIRKIRSEDAQWLFNLGIEKFDLYDNLVKQFRDTIPNWEE